MANQTYRYNVVVEVSMQTGKLNQGNQAAKSALKSWEQEQIESMRRVSREENELMKINREQTAMLQQYHSQVAATRRQDAINDYNQQKATTFRNEKELADIRTDQSRISMSNEIRDNQTRAMNNYNFHQERFRQMQAASIEQEKLAKTNADSILDIESKKAAQLINFNKQIVANDPFQSLGARQQNLQQASAALKLNEQLIQSQKTLNAQIRANDPFQNPSNRNLTFAQAGSALQSAETTRFNQQIKSLDPFQSAKNLTLSQTAKELERFDQSLNKSQKSIGIWGQAFRGAFVGAIAGMAFSLLVSAITKPLELMGQLSVRAIQLGADFEQTRNSIEVFAGSAARADRELAALDETARNTPGLRLEPAEDGYRRLRGLGFEAESARKLIAGIGKERLLSGATEQDVQRVIVNLTQLSAGSTRASMDIKEIYHSMPSLRKEFALAFGTLDPKKIGAAFGKDPQEAIKKLTDQMEKSKGAAGGLNDAWGKMEDAWITAGREFSKPVLGPLTMALKDLTTYVYNNMKTWRDWGEYVANIIEGVRAKMNPQSENEQNPNQPKKVGGYFSEAIAPTYNTYGEYWDAYQRGEITYTQFSKATNALTLHKLDRTFNDYFGVKNLFSGTEEEGKKIRAKNNANSQLNITQKRQMDDQELSTGQYDDAFRKLQEDERIRKTALDRIDSYYSQVKSMRDSYFQEDVAANQDNAEKVFAITQQNYKDQISDATAFYNQKIALNEGEETEQIKLTIERDNAIRELTTKAEVDRQNFEREQARKRIENAREYLRIEKDIIGFNYQSQNNEIDRQIELRRVSVSDGYAKLTKIQEDYFNGLRDNLERDYALQLQQSGLTSDQITNINKQKALDIAKINQDQADRILAIQDAQYQKEIQLLEENVQRKNEILQNSIAAYQELLSALDSRSIGGLNLDLVEKALFGGTTYKQLSDETKTSLSNAYNDALRDQSKTMDDLNNVLDRKPDPSDKNAQTIVRALNANLVELDAKVEKTSEGFKNWRTFIRADVNELGDLIDKIRTGTADINTFDDLRMATLKRIHSFQLKSIDNEIQAKDAAINSAVAQKRDDDAAQFRFEKSSLQQRRNLLLFQQNKEVAEAYRGTIKGINEEIDKMNSGDKQTFQDLDDIFNHNQREGLRQSMQDVYFLEKQLASPDITAEYRIRGDVLQHLIDLRTQETEAISRSLKAQIDFNRQFIYSEARSDANLAEFIASQRGITEVLSDARINAVKVAYDGLDKVAASLAKNFGLASDAVQDLLSGLLRLGLNWLFRKFLGGNAFGGNGQSGSSGGGTFNIPGIGGFGGGGSFGFPTTPGFNPNGGSFPFFGGGGSNGVFSYPGLGLMRPPGAQTGDIVTLPDGTLATQVNGDSGLLGAGQAASGVLGAGAGGLGIMGALGGLAPLAGFGLGSKIGGGKGIGGIMGGIGGLALGGTLAAILAPGLFGGATVGGGLLGIGATVAPAAGGSALMASLGTFLLNPFTIAGAGALLVGAYFLNRNMQRRRDEKTRNQAMLDAFAAIDKLIDQVNNDKIDGDSALASADEVRKSYLENMGALKDKKTRNIALKDVSRIDARIEQLKAAISGQTARRERLALSVPTFADGGTVSRFAQNNFKNNPLGYQQGFGGGRDDNMVGYFPSSGEYARYSNTEYIFDAETTRNVGTNQLELIRKTKGKSFNDMLSRLQMPRRADGGGIVPSVSMPVGGSSGMDLSKMQLVLNVNFTFGTETLFELVSAMIQSNNGSAQQITDLATTLKNQGDNELLRLLAEYVNKNK